MTREKICQLETALDHLTGEEIGVALAALNGMPQVLDAIFLTGIGKKNRPSGLLQVLCAPEDEEDVCMAIFRHTHSLGIRATQIERVILPRKQTTMPIHGSTVPAKAWELDGAAFIRPESDAIARLAGRLGSGVPGLRFEKKDVK